MTNNKNVCEDKYEFENLRRNPFILAAPHLALTVQNLLLREENLLPLLTTPIIIISFIFPPTLRKSERKKERERTSC